MQHSGNIFLVGLMGAGKTTVGKLLAQHLNKRFVDCDREIENRSGVSIPLIFEIEGEAGFRRRESRLLEELAARDDLVLATGGGAVLSGQNRKLLASRGTVVYLRASVHELWLRTRYDKNRPLLQGNDVRSKLRTLYAQRDPLYREIADIIVDTSRQSVRTLVLQLEQDLQRPGNLSCANSL
ncbi:MAG: shikimate kinase [Burkholderiales bacterium]